MNWVAQALENSLGSPDSGWNTTGLEATEHYPAVVYSVTKNMVPTTVCNRFEALDDDSVPTTQGPENDWEKLSRGDDDSVPTTQGSENDWEKFSRGEEIFGEDPAEIQRRDLEESFESRGWKVITSKRKQRWRGRRSFKKGKGNDNAIMSLTKNDVRFPMPVMAVSQDWVEEETGGWYKVRATLDSGTVEHVAPEHLAPEVVVAPSAGSSMGQTYCVANGEDIPNRGQKVLDVINECGAKGKITYQITDVSKPLMSVGQTCDQNCAVLFTKTGGMIFHLDTQMVTPFERKGGQYEVIHWIQKGAEQAASFGRPGA